MENEYLQMLAQIVLPTQILDYFTIAGIEQTGSEIHISLDEKMNPELSGDLHFLTSSLGHPNQKLDGKSG